MGLNNIQEKLDKKNFLNLFFVSLNIIFIKVKTIAYIM